MKIAVLAYFVIMISLSLSVLLSSGENHQESTNHLFSGKKEFKENKIAASKKAVSVN